MHWLYLLGAILFEVMGTLSIKQTTLSNNYYWVIAVITFYSISFVLLGITVKKLEIGTVYAIWAGFGVVLVTLLGWLIFKETMSLQKVVAIMLIITGTVMLKLQQTV
ncbi:multidrug efflux SMR transporter [Sulfuricurvum sp. IAE1]|uniref:DMT family transporter n=1 Tax=Sulfuricurvum sp. IAE1 TaxID=2546102 RepID=UPI0010497B76|nr:multidrug efflux SMR transporter [Sulfuricurvum sp. IAE1]TDA62499.1 multidrug efflux SMR transporter [Sulfuricurvum sp. IAE1]